MFTKKDLNSDNKPNNGDNSNNNINNMKWIYAVKYNSFFETFKYPNPIDFFFGIITLTMITNSGFGSAIGIILPWMLIDGYFWFASSGNKIILTEQAVASNMWAKSSFPYSEIISCEIRDTDTLIIKSKSIGNFYLHGLHMFEFERIKNIIDEKIHSKNVETIENNSNELNKNNN